MHGRMNCSVTLTIVLIRQFNGGSPKAWALKFFPEVQTEHFKSLPMGHSAGNKKFHETISWQVKMMS